MMMKMMMMMMMKCGYGNFNHQYNVSPIHFLVWGNFMKVISSALTTYEVVSDYRKFEKH
jgi:hypothetical protein